MKLNSLASRAKEQQERKGVVGKWLAARRQWMIMTPSAIEKVGLSGVTKPIIDPLIKQSFGRIAGSITGIKPTRFDRIFSTYRQMKNQASAESFMKNMNNAYVDAIVKYDKIKDKNSDAGKQAFKELQDAELNHAASLGYLFINAGSHIDIAQVMTKGATDLDAAMGKYKQSSYKERTKAQEAAFWIEAVNRTHSAIKSVSARQALLDGYTENLQLAQKETGSISNEQRQRAWDSAVLNEMEQGRFGESTLASNLIGKMKSSDNAAVRNTANYLLPVAKISINITKQGIDMALPFVELPIRTFGTDAFRGIKLNAEDGKEYNNFASKYYDGIKRGFSELPLEQKKYINTLISRGLFGAAQYALVGFGLATGNIKYGGDYDPNDPFGKHKPKGTDGLPLKAGEWEFFGQRAPKVLNLVINHSPYSLPASLAAVTYDQYHIDDKKTAWQLRAFSKTLNEVYQRLPFATGIDMAKALLGSDQYKLEHIVANEAPTMKATSEYFDKDSEGNVRKVQTQGDGFWSTTGKIVQSRLPIVRNQMESATGIKDINSPEYKLMASYNMGLSPYNPKSLNMQTSSGEDINVEPDKYKEFTDRRQQLFTQGISNLVNGKTTYEDKDNKGKPAELSGEQIQSLSQKDLTTYINRLTNYYVQRAGNTNKQLSSEEAAKLSPDEMKGYLMAITKKADKQAMWEVFKGVQKEKEQTGKKVVTE